MAQGDETGAYTTLEPIAKDGPPAYKTLALMQQGNIRMAADKPEEGAALFDKAAAAAPNVVLGDLARLKAALALLDTAPYPQLQTWLAALIETEKPHRTCSRARGPATAKLSVGKTAEARGDFSALMLTLGVTDGMKQRAQSAIARKSDGKRLDLHDPGIIDGAGDVRIGVAVNGLRIDEREFRVRVVHDLHDVGGRDVLYRGSGGRGECGIVESVVLRAHVGRCYECQSQENCYRE